MNFDFSDDLKQMRDEAGRLLREKAAIATSARPILNGGNRYDESLWKTIADLGWLGIAIPEQFGGSAVGYQGLCLLAEQLGRSLAPVPFLSSVYLATEALLIAGTSAQKQRFLPALAKGSLIGTFALTEGLGNPSSESIKTRVKDGVLSGRKIVVPDGGIADFAIVAAKDSEGKVCLVVADVRHPGVRRTDKPTIDPTRNHATIEFANVPCEPLEAEDAWAVVMQLLDRAAVLVAFEQIGGAQACLDMARDYAVERYAFGRPIGSFQAIKHKLAQIFIAIELARSNAYFGAWAMSEAQGEQTSVAAAVARLSATRAYELAAKENIQTHGGVGFTWEFDCHLYYRRSKLLALALGSPPFWSERLMQIVATNS
ncbi:MAG TPA: acyl-CoA dehydrogenase family protein [Pseudorhodoplanes sp.]|nr:acyl-CoA dehydrogenase family protein [Pseudorhodoplanes sp.]